MSRPVEDVKNQWLTTCESWKLLGLFTVRYWTARRSFSIHCIYGANPPPGLTHQTPQSDNK